ncbi:PD-(D/E)XK motif protein [Sinorhizobium meliloti]|uniref:PD-(D/E)XK motif protein n=1 Tax=Rhizobium meliloti TaxID=382 RepID=UPI0023809499|nr:PD-(D/E)XK motif protein [Sinorhizobium meliloti]MDE3775442.1 PD-(D/E)XK motif protein [Sinorhizobium meliloti]
MSVTPDAAALLREWDELAVVAPGDRLYRTRRLSRPVQLDLRAGLRETDGAPCLVAVPGGTGNSIASFETAGLRLSRAADPGGVLLVLSLEETSRRDLFAEICSDCIRSVLRCEDEGESELVTVFAARLAAWRAFLRDQTGGLSRNEIVGLIGELVVLDRLLDGNAEAVAAWKAPDDGLHDFVLSGHGLEVKTALGPAQQLHISTLDQLDDAGLVSLHVAHVRLVESVAGETLGQITARIEQRLNGERARSGFRNALLRRGLAPGGDTNAGPRVACAGIDCYAVNDGFPRVRRRDVALGIAEATYQVEVRALVGFAVNAVVVLDAFGGTGNE